VIINIHQAYSSRHQAFFDHHELSFGVQYEIARLHTIGCLEYSDISIPALGLLKGPNAEAAPKTSAVLLGLVTSESEAYTLAFAKEVALKVKKMHNDGTSVHQINSYGPHVVAMERTRLRREESSG
jgi:hypothetical protein